MHLLYFAVACFAVGAAILVYVFKMRPIEQFMVEDEAAVEVSEPDVEPSENLPMLTSGEDLPMIYGPVAEAEELHYEDTYLTDTKA